MAKHAHHAKMATITPANLDSCLLFPPGSIGICQTIDSRRSARRHRTIRRGISTSLRGYKTQVTLAQLGLVWPHARTAGAGGLLLQRQPA